MAVLSGALLVGLVLFLALTLRPGQSTAVIASPGDNEMAADANHTGTSDTSIQATRTVSGSGDFDVGINVTVAGIGYSTYQVYLQWDPSVLELVSAAHLNQGGFVICGTFASTASDTRSSCSNFSGASTFVGPHVAVTLRCKADGTSALHLVTLAESPTFGTTTIAPPPTGNIATDLVDAEVTCENVPTPTPTPTPGGPTATPTPTVTPTPTNTPTSTPTPTNTPTPTADCVFLDDFGRGTRFLVNGTSGEFSGPGVFADGVNVFRTSTLAMAVGFADGVLVIGRGVCPVGPGTYRALRFFPFPLTRWTLEDVTS